MSDSDWSKIDFQHFLNDYGIDLVVTIAPTILYSKKDKEHEALNSLIAFFFIAGGLLIYIAVSYFLAPIYFSLPSLIIIIIIATIMDVFLLINYNRSNVYIRPIECWFEVYKGKQESDVVFYCFTFYPIFTGKCHPNVAKNVLYKLYQEQILKSKIDITQIEVYLKLKQSEKRVQEGLGFFFQYGEGNPFKDEEINRNSWKFFPFQKTLNDNYLAVANWEHQYEWRDDLEYDFDKLHEYAPWVIHKWNKFNLKPLTEEFKEKVHWDERYLESKPKLKSWNGALEKQLYENPLANKDLETISEVIEKVVGKNKRLEKVKDIKDDLPMIKSYFRDLIP
ncbi:MAG: hypothetical protein Lokiarch_33650 [Candidatus Lokiarchaeum sp. GC14_75]|nr:MAG: hypothetical protein Lokiarch_33650 [Candidatus Lokiarchaeum sp. GC14_75]